MRRAFELGIILLAVAVGTTPATALVLSRSQVECQEAIAKQGLRFLAGVVDLEQRCHDADLRAGAGACPASKIALLRFRLVDRLHTELEEHCAGGAPVLARLGFPGRCADPNPADGFTVADLAACLEAGTARAVEGVCSGGSNDGESCSVVADCPDSGPGTVCRGLISTEYDPRVVGPLASQPLGCQTTLADASSRFMAAVLKAVHRCRLDMLDCKLDPVSGLPRCKIEGIAPGQCAV